jgi:very-short-patch-repair endonuclease
MRHAPTPSEALLFQALRAGQLGVTFRRQVTLLGRFIADFLAPEVKLVVEVDGLYHARREAADARRERALVRAGYHVVHVEAELVTRDIDAAVGRVAEALARLR